MPSLSPFRAAYAADDVAHRAHACSPARPCRPTAEARIDAHGAALVEAIRGKGGGLGGVEELLREYSLSTQRGPGADGARRGAAARARRGDGRPADRGQARPGRLRRITRRASRRAAGLGLRLGARHHGAHHPAGRDAGGHPRLAGQAPRRCRRCAPRRARPCGCSAATSCSARPSARRWSARARARGTAVPPLLRHAGRGRPHAGRRRAATSTSYADAIEAIGRAAGNEPLPDRPGHLGEALGAAPALRGPVSASA